MKIKIENNINYIKKKIIKKRDKMRITLDNISQIIAERMAQDMKDYLDSTRGLWYIEYEKFSHLIGNSNYDIRVVPLQSSTQIQIGNITEPLVMNDGKYVNPYFFIEFGFGIYGQDNPSPNADKFEWNYNINNHTTFWFFIGYDGEKHSSYGLTGVNFISTIVEKYKNDWVNIVISELEKM